MEAAVPRGRARAQLVLTNLLEAAAQNLEKIAKACSVLLALCAQMAVIKYDSKGDSLDK